MLKLTPVLLAMVHAFVLYRLSAWRTKRALRARSSVLVEDPALGRLNARMARTLALPRLEVHIYEVDAINGLAAPDGRLFVTRGFYDAYRAGAVTAAELASVIAHELGHVALGHSRRRMIDFSFQNAMRTVVATILNRILPGLGLVAANLMAGLVSARLSRQDEYEADAYAAALLHKSGIGTGAQKSLLAKLERLASGPAARPPAWLSSHPATAQRIQAIERMEARWAASCPRGPRRLGPPAEPAGDP
ncbi:MAG: M48 family metalloprotease [Pseudomonadota bacterium]